MRGKKSFLIIIMMLITVPALAVEYPQPTSWVNDYANVLTSSQKQELDSLLGDFEHATTNQIFVGVMSDLPAEIGLEEYVNELFERWQPGQEGQDNGVLLAIFINDRQIRIEVGYGLEDKLTDATSKLIITNDITPSFKQSNYYLGIKNGINSIMRAVKGDYRPPPAKPPRSSYQRRRASDEWKIFAIVLFLVFVFVLQVYFHVTGRIECTGGSSGWSSRRDRDWSSSRSRSSSGWGSSSRSSRSSSSRSSRSFSGGGGGRSGGGGASGSW